MLVDSWLIFGLVDFWLTPWCRPYMWTCTFCPSFLFSQKYGDPLSFLEKLNFDELGIGVPLVKFSDLQV